MAQFRNLNDLSKHLQKKVKEASGNVSISELLNDAFMQKYTDFENSQEFFDKSPFKFETQEEWDQIDEKEKDDYVKIHTRFDTWNEMLQKAAQEYFARLFK